MTIRIYLIFDKFPVFGLLSRTTCTESCMDWPCYVHRFVRRTHPLHWIMPVLHLLSSSVPFVSYFLDPIPLCWSLHLVFFIYLWALEVVTLLLLSTSLLHLITMHLITSMQSSCHSIFLSLPYRFVCTSVQSHATLRSTMLCLQQSGKAQRQETADKETEYQDRGHACTCFLDLHDFQFVSFCFWWTRHGILPSTSLYWPWVLIPVLFAFWPSEGEDFCSETSLYS